MALWSHCKREHLGLGKEGILTLFLCTLHLLLWLALGCLGASLDEMSTEALVAYHLFSLSCIT